MAQTTQTQREHYVSATISFAHVVIDVSLNLRL